MKITISVDTHEVTDELHRLMVAPDTKTMIAFSAIFAAMTAEVMALVHIETGSLKSTVKWDSPAYPLGWQGTIRVGGAAPGMPRDPAYYGVFELARGGTHFFFAPAYANIPSQMVNAIVAFYDNSGVKSIEAMTPSLSGVAKVAAKSVEKYSANKAKEKAAEAKKKLKKRLAEDIAKGAKGAKDKGSNGFYIGDS